MASRAPSWVSLVVFRAHLVDFAFTCCGRLPWRNIVQWWWRRRRRRIGTFVEQLFSFQRLCNYLVQVYQECHLEKAEKRKHWREHWILFSFFLFLKSQGQGQGQGYGIGHRNQDKRTWEYCRSTTVMDVDDIAVSASPAGGFSR